MKKFGHAREVTREVPFGSFRHTLTTPRNQNVLGQARVRVRHFHIGELHPPFRELFDQVHQFTIYKGRQRPDLADSRDD